MVLWLLVRRPEKAGTRVMSAAVDCAGGWGPAARGPVLVRRGKRWLEGNV